MHSPLARVMDPDAMPLCGAGTDVIVPPGRRLSIGSDSRSRATTGTAPSEFFIHTALSKIWLIAGEVAVTGPAPQFCYNLLL